MNTSSVPTETTPHLKLGSDGNLEFNSPHVSSFIARTRSISQAIGRRLRYSTRGRGSVIKRFLPSSIIYRERSDRYRKRSYVRSIACIGPNTMFSILFETHTAHRDPPCQTSGKLVFSSSDTRVYSKANLPPDIVVRNSGPFDSDCTRDVEGAMPQWCDRAHTRNNLYSTPDSRHQHVRVHHRCTSSRAPRLDPRPGRTCSSRPYSRSTRIRRASQEASDL